MPLSSRRACKRAYPTPSVGNGVGAEAVHRAWAPGAYWCLVLPLCAWFFGFGASSALAEEGVLTIRASSSYVDQRADRRETRYALPSDVRLRVIFGDVVGDAISILVPADSLPSGTLHATGMPDVEVSLRSAGVGSLATAGSAAGRLELILPLRVRSAGQVIDYNLSFTTEATPVVGRSVSVTGAKLGEDGSVSLVATSALRNALGTTVGDYYAVIQGRLGPLPSALSVARE